MKSNIKIIPLIGAYVFVGAFITFLLFYKLSSLNDALLIGAIFTTILFLVLIFVQRFVRKILLIFNRWQALIITTFLYIFAFIFAFLSIFIFYTISVTHKGDAINLIGQTIIGGFSYLVTLPFHVENTPQIFTHELQNIFITISGLIFLIGLFSLLVSYIESHWKAIYQRQLIADAELRALRAQMDPHFLFNSINTIVSIVQEKPQHAEKLLIKLSDLLRYLFLDNSKENIYLKDELKFTKNYFSLMMARFPDKLNIYWNESFTSNDIVVPALLFQPIVENSIKHGWKNKSHGFSIRISVIENGGDLEITIEDDGMGISSNQLKKLPIKNHALANLQDRLRITYKLKNPLSISSIEGRGTTIYIKIPVTL